jgi:precorrin-4/cobalt-precorrin-4 C11-methyltransferase
MCIFLSVSMMTTVVDELIAGGYTEDTPIAVIEKASWPEEKKVLGTLGTIAEAVRESGIKKTAMILVGPALDMESTIASKLYDRDFKHEYR